MDQSEPVGSSGSSNGVPPLPDANSDAGALQDPPEPPEPCDPTKRGVAYAFDQNSAVSDMSALGDNTVWWYNWNIAPRQAIRDQYQALGVEFVPMVWGRNVNVDELVNAIPAGAKYLLGFNEPNFGSQSNITPQQAADLWPRLEEIADRRNLTLVSPAPNFCAGDCNETDPFVWLDKFFAACPGCRVDHIAAHWYACTPEALEWYLDHLRVYGRPIWITEFACWDDGPHSAEAVEQYARDSVRILEADPDVFRYSWFSGRTNAVPHASLLAGAGQLTAVGRAYAGAPLGCDSP